MEVHIKGEMGGLSSAALIKCKEGGILAGRFLRTAGARDVETRRVGRPRWGGHIWVFEVGGPGRSKKRNFPTFDWNFPFFSLLFDRLTGQD